jgi:hypothetical protein
MGDAGVRLSCFYFAGGFSRPVIATAQQHRPGKTTAAKRDFFETVELITTSE